MRQSVENGQQRIVVPAYRVAIKAQSAAERIHFIHTAPCHNSYEAAAQALYRFNQAHPKSEVSSIRVTVRK